MSGTSREVRAPVLEASITDEGVIPILQEVEGLRTTGELRFEGNGQVGTIPLVCGELGSGEASEDGRDPVDVLLELRSGTVQVFQLLPALPVSHGGDRERHGSLSVHAPADLMNFCERAGLTGSLSLERKGRTAVALYERGDLKGIRLDGDDEADLHEVFGWEDGNFRIAVRGQAVTPLVPDAVPDQVEEPAAAEVRTSGRPTTDTGQRFLRVMEVELSRIVSEREQKRPTRESNELPKMPRPRSRHPTLPGLAPRPSPTPTVKVVYLGSPGEDVAHAGVRHAAAGGAEAALPDAAPDRMKTVRIVRPAASGQGPPPATGSEPRRGGPGQASRLVRFGQELGWAVVVLLIGLSILGFLAWLPTLE